MSLKSYLDWHLTPKDTPRDMLEHVCGFSRATDQAPSEVLRSEHRVITCDLEVRRHLAERSERGERLKISA